MHLDKPYSAGFAGTLPPTPDVMSYKSCRVKLLVLRKEIMAGHHFSAALVGSTGLVVSI